MKILVCGGRDFGHVVRTCSPISAEPPHVQKKLEEYRFIQEALNAIVYDRSELIVTEKSILPTDITIISGGATGADSAAEDFGDVNFCKVEIYPAEWNKYGRGAGYIRNKQMLVEGKPDLVVAFPGGRGTAMMVDIARTAGVEVMEITMGTLGHATQQVEEMLEKQEGFRTKRFEQVYITRMSELSGSSSVALRKHIMREVMKQERDWLNSMGQEYEEIMLAQEVADKIKP